VSLDEYKLLNFAGKVVHVSQRTLGQMVSKHPR
jgi:hypothetical protein